MTKRTEFGMRIADRIDLEVTTVREGELGFGRPLRPETVARLREIDENAALALIRLRDFPVGNTYDSGQ